MTLVKVRARRWITPNGARLSLGHGTHRTDRRDGWYLTVRHGTSGIVTGEHWLRDLDSADPAARHRAVLELTRALAMLDAVPYIGPEPD
jgi:hypothetical protein